jgi:hypothetical protein
MGVGLALTKHRRSLILRRQAVQVTDVVEQIKRFAGKQGQWRGLGYGGVMTMDDGRTIEVGGCDHEDEKTKYMGRPHDLIVFDEATHFTRSQVLFISAWNRHEDPSQLCQIVMPTNPPTTPEGRWIVEEFAPWLDSEYYNPAKPCEVRWYIRHKGEIIWVESSGSVDIEGEIVKPRSRTFIPGRLKDNPILAATDYGSKLQALPEPLRSQLLYGDFSAGTDDAPWQVIPTDWVRQAQRRWTPDPPEGQPMSAVGVDPARAGVNKTVLSKRYGRWFAKLIKLPGSQTPDGPSVATIVVKEREDDAHVNVDVVGIGSSVYDSLKDCDFFKTFPINNGESRSVDKMRDRSGRLKFANLRAASYWKLREDLDPSGPEPISLPPDNELLSDLTAANYKLVGGGKIQLERKEEIIDRIGRSPDCADAVVMAAWEPSRLRAGVMRVYRHSFSDKKKPLHLLILKGDQMSVTEVDNPALLVVIQDPPLPVADNKKEDVIEAIPLGSWQGKGVFGTKESEVMSSDSRGVLGVRLLEPALEGLCVEEEGKEVMSDSDESTIRGGCSSDEQTIPSHGIKNLVDVLKLEFLDIDPADHQKTWGDKVEKWNKTPTELSLQPEQARRLWSFLARQRSSKYDVVVIYESEGRRAMSLGVSICNAMRCPVEDTLYRPGVDNKVEVDVTTECNRQVLECLRLTRGATL